MKPHPFWLIPPAAVITGVLLPSVTGAFTPNFQWLSVYGDRMDNYDTEYGNPSLLDWPVGMIWGCKGYQGDVKNYLPTLPTPYAKISGSNKQLRVWEADYGGNAQNPTDSGNQTACFDGYDGNACMSGDRCTNHTRIYAPGGSYGNCFKNMYWDFYSVATQHYDLNHADCVGTGQQRYGWSEVVEARIRNQARARYPTNASMYDMQTYGYDWIDSTHYHQSDGYAQYVDFGNCWTPTPKPTPKPTATPTPSK
jgi:hypothetical protein